MNVCYKSGSRIDALENSNSILQTACISSWRADLPVEAQILLFGSRLYSEDTRDIKNIAVNVLMPLDLDKFS